MVPGFDKDVEGNQCGNGISASLGVEDEGLAVAAI
jgi:hypothetical protein